MAKAVILGMAILFFVPILLLINYTLHTIDQKNARTGIPIVFLFSLLTWLIIFANVPSIIPDKYQFLPRITLTITNTGERNQRSDGETATISLFNTGTTQSFNTLEKENWVRNDGELRAAQQGTLIYRGTVFKEIQLTLLTGRDHGIVEIDWNGERQRIDTFSPADGQIYIVHPFAPSILNQTLVFLLSFIPAYFLIFMLLAFWLKRPRVRQTISVPRHWIWLALPMLILWTILLLSFSPGLMSGDSIEQWGQSLSGKFNDWHPTLYALFLLPFSRLTGSPAFAALTQIIALSLTTAWGIGLLRKFGLSNRIAWIFATCFALLPINLFFPITLWKDVPFGISLLTAFFILLAIILTDGDWLAGRWNWIGLAIAGTGITLFRHNGFPVMLLTFILLLIFLRNARKPLFFALCSFLAIVCLFQYPIANLLHVQKTAQTGINQLFVHHFSAHIEEKTEISEEDRAWLNQLYPLERWIYNPWSAGSIQKMPGFRTDLLYQNTEKNIQTLAHLIQTNPLASVRHAFRASDMIWHVPCHECYLYTVPLSQGKNEPINWVVANRLGIHPNSRIPQFVQPLHRFFMATLQSPIANLIFWRPAFLTYLGFFAAMIFILRSGKPKNLLILTLPALQFGMMLLITFAQDMRFQYGQMLIGACSLPLFFLPTQDEEK